MLSTPMRVMMSQRICVVLRENFMGGFQRFAMEGNGGVGYTVYGTTPMLRAQNNSPHAPFRSSLAVILALAVVAGLLATGAVRIALRAQAIHGEAQALKQRTQALAAEKKQLEESIRAAGSAEGIERMAKEFLNLKQPGEEVVVVTSEQQASAPLPQSAGFWVSVRDLLQKLWRH